MLKRLRKTHEDLTSILLTKADYTKSKQWVIFR